MSTAPTTFVGTSKYSSDLEQVLSRAVSIASLPLTQLTGQLTTLQSQASAVDGLNTNFAAIQTALTSLSTGISSTSATVSDTSVATVQTNSNTLAGTYSLTVTDPGSQTSTLSKTGLITVADPSTQSLTTAATLTLTVGGTSFTLNPATSSLNSLAQAINASGSGLTATIVNVGPPSAPDYRLAVQNQELGAVAVQLNDGSQDLLDTLVTGTPAQYQVNGQPAVPISSNSRSVTIAPGLTANLLTAGTTTITVARTSSALANSLSSLVTAYNAAVDALNQNRGQGGGALTGDSLISTLTQSLRNLNGYSGGSGAVQDLADLGITLDKTGKLSLDQSTLLSVVTNHPDDVAAFLGSSTSGGFLKTAGDTLTSLEDPTSGTFQNLHDNLQTEIANQNTAISTMQDRIDQIQTNLTAQISAADALIASLESQVSYFTALFNSMENANNNQNN